MYESDIKILKEMVGRYGFKSILRALQGIAETWSRDAREKSIKSYYTAVAGGLEESHDTLGSGLV